MTRNVTTAKDHKSQGIHTGKTCNTSSDCAKSKEICTLRVFYVFVFRSSDFGDSLQRTQGERRFVSRRLDAQ